MATLSLNTCTVQHSRAILNRVHIFFHFTAIAALLYFRISHILNSDENLPVFAWGLMTTAELFFTFMWFVTQGFRWRPVTRTVLPENLPANVEFPGVDVFVCTDDPEKEPVLEVMNTVLSAMALDYPTEKLAVYLSDDAGAATTLDAVKEACSFAKSWIPFCRKYGIKTRCPEAYFSTFGDDERILRTTDEFKAEEKNVKSKYEGFKKNVQKADDFFDTVSDDRPPCIEVIHDNRCDRESEDNQTKMPLLVYMSRERRPSHPHRFKAGALNALLRVSGIMSNGEYLLALDCDMYCNEPASAKQAMCFHLDPKMPSSLAFVQYPQIFYNVSKNDIYDGQARSAYKTKYQGMDGLRGASCAGTGYYLKKKALYGSPNQQDEFLLEPEKNFGQSKKFIDSLKGNDKETINGKGNSSEAILDEASKLASCSYEENTEWGKEASIIVGYSYECLLESTFTGYRLHCRGWQSVYLYPKRPCFLGCTTIDMKDAFVQLMKWSSELLQVGISSYSPLTYGMSRMSILQSMCYGYYTFFPILSVPCVLYGSIPQLCFLYGIPLFPKVSNPWFAVFATLYISSLCQHIYEVLSSGGSMTTWWNEHRIWMIKTVTACLFGCLDGLMKCIGITKAKFRLTNKAIDQEKLEKYEKGVFDFEAARMFMIPLVLLIVLNLGCFVGGVKRMVSEGNFEEMFGQAFLSSSIVVSSYSVVKGLLAGK
ncbi:hypothetical protein LguiB_025782 [Lonicera macranthoides]